MAGGGSEVVHLAQEQHCLMHLALKCVSSLSCLGSRLKAIATLQDFTECDVLVCRCLWRWQGR